MINSIKFKQLELVF